MAARTLPLLCSVMFCVIVGSLGQGGRNNAAEASDDENMCICPALMAPVCSKANETFANRCLADCDGVMVACEGECPCSPGGQGGGNNTGSGTAPPAANVTVTPPTGNGPAVTPPFGNGNTTGGGGGNASSSSFKPWTAPFFYKPPMPFSLQVENYDCAEGIATLSLGMHSAAAIMQGHALTGGDVALGNGTQAGNASAKRKGAEPAMATAAEGNKVNLLSFAVEPTAGKRSFHYQLGTGRLIICEHPEGEAIMINEAEDANSTKATRNTHGGMSGKSNGSGIGKKGGTTKGGGSGNISNEVGNTDIAMQPSCTQMTLDTAKPKSAYLEGLMQFRTLAAAVKDGTWLCDDTSGSVAEAGNAVLYLDYVAEQVLKHGLEEQFGLQM